MTPKRDPEGHATRPGPNPELQGEGAKHEVHITDHHARLQATERAVRKAIAALDHAYDQAEGMRRSPYRNNVRATLRRNALDLRSLAAGLHRADVRGTIGR